MADDEATLAAEIARLEAELEQARLESQLQHLKAELNAVEGVVNSEEYMVIQDLVKTGSHHHNDDNDEEYSYEEYDDEEYIEEFEEEIIEEEYEEEYEEEEEEEVYEIEEEEEVHHQAPVPEQAPTRTVYSDLQKAHGNLRKAPVALYQQKDAEVAAVVAATAPKPVAAKVVAQPSPAPKPTEPPKPKVKKPVRPPPSQGGKPVPREDPKAEAKPTKRYPLSRLLQRNKKSVDVPPPESSSSSPTSAMSQPPPVSKPPAKVIPTKATAVAATTTAVKGAPAAKKAAAAATKPSGSTGGPFKRRVIPNLQPSPEGQESIFEQLLGPKLITNPQLHKCSTKGCVKNQELIGLYFGAMWKSDCKRFNAVLKDFYYNTAAANNFEVIYISADRSLIEFKDCYTTMPFLAMPAGTTSIKNELTKALKINEMPALVVLDDEGNVVTVQGVQKIMELEKGNVEQANQLIDRWKKTRPIPISEVKMDNTLLHGTMERGTVYWQN